MPFARQGSMSGRREGPIMGKSRIGYGA